MVRGSIGGVAGLAIREAGVIEIYVAPTRRVVTLTTLTRVVVGWRVDRMARSAVR